MNWDYDFDDDTSFLNSPFGDGFDQSNGFYNGDTNFFNMSTTSEPTPPNPIPQMQISMPPPQPQIQSSPNSPQAPSFYPEFQDTQNFFAPQQFPPQNPQPNNFSLYTYSPNQMQPPNSLSQQQNMNLIEENNQLRQFFYSLKQKAEQVDNQNQKLKGQLNECRNWFKTAMFSGMHNGSK